MKTPYISPVVVGYTIQEKVFIAGSNDGVTTANVTNQESDEGEEVTNSPSVSLSRQPNMWGDKW